VQAGENATVVLRNVAELKKRERLRQRGASLVLQLFRLVKVSQFHALDNMAVLQALDQTVVALRGFSAHASEPLSLLFMRGTIFVGGDLLKASRTEYEAALELARLVEGIGMNEIRIDPGAARSDLEALLELLRTKRGQPASESLLRPSPHVRLRRVAAAALGADDEELSPEEQIFRTYASAIVVMRGLFDNVAQGRYELPHQAKRLAQRLVALSEGDTPAFLGVTAMRSANHDAAGRAVNTSILAVAMGRQLTEDNAVLSRLAMAALLHDVAEAYVAGSGRGDGALAWALSEQDEKRLPAATALVLTALGHLRPASIVRATVAYEAQWLRRPALFGPLYRGTRPVSAMSRLVATAHRFNDLLTLDPAADRACTPDEAITLMKVAAQHELDRKMIDLLVGAIGMFPSGTPVELSTGEIGVVVSTPDHPAQYVKPSVRLVYDAQGEPLHGPAVVKLVDDPLREVHRVVTEPDERLRAVSELAFQRARSSIPPPYSPGADVTVRPSPRPREEPPPATRESSVPPAGRASLPPSSGLRPAPNALRQSIPAARASQPPAQRANDASKVAPLLAQSQFAPSDEAAAASGALARTPLSQLLVYALDRSLTGSLLLIEDCGDFIDEHAVYFRDGAPAKVYTSNLVEPLSAMLASRGLVSKEQLEDGILRKVAGQEADLETALLEHELVSETALGELRSEQLRARLVSLFKLPSETTYYAFFPHRDLCERQWGKLTGTVAPLSVLAAGLREHPDDVAIDLVLARAGDHPVALHPDADLESFAFSPDEFEVVMRLSREASRVPALLREAHDVAATRRVIYILMLTRSVELAPGSESGPASPGRP
jgi:HD-GYP domain-containing protein (c-di-GMP phosphodiesterase class II)